MLRFILCDDDELQLDEIAGFIRQWADTNKINVEISQFTSGKAVLEQFQPQRNDIVICDIMMPDMDGLTLANSLRSLRPDFHIIFMSSSKDFALQAYDAHPYGYLVKPCSYEAFSALLGNLMQKVRMHTLSVYSGHETYKLPITDISFVEATNRQTVFNMKDGRSIATRDTLASIQDVLLKYPAFFKPHRSYIINLQYVEHFNSKEISMKNSACLIPIARGLDKEFKEKYFQFMFSE
ncbi:LytR/AlgR family response regulator transcription factor [Phascolarctobacterium sp.]|uniref:LytR/AlgR family response regulator transcription factor n=1 Tax=Phascolarctobacterium sp. TaxID=2049039 RepID=UPI003F81D87E